MFFTYIIKWAGSWSRGLIVGCSLCIAYLGFFASVATAAPATGWMQNGSLPDSLFSASTVAGSNGYIYAIGDSWDGSNQQKLYIYNPATDTWSMGASIPNTDKLTGNALVYSGSTLYAIGGGGQFSGNTFSSAVYTYDAAANTWSTSSVSLPQPLKYVSASVQSDGTIYAFGFYNNGTTNGGALYHFKPGVDSSWTQVTGLPAGLSFPGPMAASSSGTIYFMEASATGKFYSYIPGTNTWTPLADSPYRGNSKGVTIGSFVEYNGVLHLLGGYDANSGNGLYSTLIYNMNTNTWSYGPNMVRNLSYLGAVVSNDVLYTVGGSYGGGGPVNFTYSYYDGPTGLSHNSMMSSGWTESWSAVPGAASYNVYVDGVQVNASPIIGTTYDVTGQSPGTTYSVTVTAVNGTAFIGSSALESVASSADSVATLPSAPTNLSHSSITTTGWTESWDAVTGATSYNVYVDGVKVNGASPIIGLTYNVTGQASGTTFSVTVKAVNASGEGAASSADSVTTKPGAPTGLSSSVHSTTGWTQAWTAVTGASGYNVYVDGVKVNGASPINGTTYDVTGQTPGTTYSVTVTAVNASGEGPASSANSVTSIPSSPTGLSHGSITSTGWTQTWTAVTGASGYNVYVDGVKVNGASPIIGLTYNVTGQASGTTFSVTVKAVNASGEGAASSADSVTTKPGAPTGLSSSAHSTTGWTQAWTAVTGASGYNVYIDGVKVNGASPINGTTYDVTGQTPGTTYSVTVTAVNASGEGPASSADSVETIPSVPTGLSHGSITSTGWTQTWTAVTGASGYNVYVDGVKVNGASPITVLTYDVTGQASGTDFSVTVTAVNGSGEGAASSADSVTTKPGAPTGLSSSAHSTTGWTQAWTAVTGASGYNVYIDGVKVNGASPINGTTYDVTGQTPGTTYSVTVTAVNASGEGPASSPYSVETIPSTPTGLSHSTITSTGWTQTWTAVTGASGYNVYVDGVKVNGASPISGTSYNVTGQTSGTTFSVTVTAVNGSGEGAASSTDSVTTIPSAPTGLSSSAHSTTGWTQTWTAVTGASGYNVYIDGVKVNGASPINGTTYDVTGQTPGTTYSVTVTAVNASGEGPASSDDSVGTIPSVPTGLSHGSITSTGWTQTWTAVTGASGYNVYVDGVKVNGASPIIGLTYNVTGQASGTDFSVTVTAVNGSGEGAASSVDSVTTKPGASTGLSHSSITSTGWTQTWTAVTGASGYNVYVDGVKVNGVSPINGTTYDVTGQTPGTTYSVTVTAVNASGEGPASSDDSVGTIPSVPTGLSHGSITSTGWTQTWTAVTGASGYNVYVDGVKVNGASPITVLSYDVTGQASGTDFSVTVTAVNGSGEGAVSSADSVTTKPGAPTGLSHSSITSTGWTQTWTAVTGASGYNVYVDGVKVNGASPINGTTYDVTGQTPGTTYSVTVTAVNASGEGPASSPYSVETIPSTPTGLSHSTITSTGWTQTWTAVTGASGYNVYVDGVKVNGASPIIGLTYNVTGQASGTDFSVTVTAVNGSGEGAASSADSVTTKPGAPTGLSSSAHSTTGWTQTWTAVTGANGYNVYVDGVKVNGASPINGTTYDVTGQTPGTTYTVTVTAVNASGEGPASSDDSVGTIPSVPTGLSHGSITSTGWTQTWTAVTGASGYNVYVDGVKVNGTSPISGTTYSVTGQNSSTTYFVTVKAVNASGEGAASSADSVTTALFVSSNADLSGLTLSSGALSPTFASSTVSYTSNVANPISSITVTANVYDTASSVTASVYNSGNILVFGPINLTVGQASDPLPLAEGGNRIAVTVTAQDGSQQIYYVNVTRETATTPSQPGPSQPGGPSQPNVPSPPIVPSPPTVPAEIIKLSGVVMDAVVKKETTSGGQPVTRVTLDANELGKALSSATTPSVTLEIKNSDPVVKVDFPAAALLDAASKQPDTIVQIKVDGATYSLPVNVLKNVPKDAVITVTITKVSGKTSSDVDAAVDQQGSKHLLENPIDYSMSSDGEEVTDFNGTYVDRTIALNSSVDSSKVTAVWVDVNNQIHFIPSVFANSGDIANVTIHSPHNSVYTVIQSDKTFADLKGHWAKADIELLANKLVVKGITNTKFAPDNNITRAEFAALLVRSLGLVENSAANAYTDVKATDWYSGAVGAAQKAGLISGTANGAFMPNANITREQMVSMIARALKLGGKEPTVDMNVLDKFTDHSDIADWAKEAAAQSLVAHIIQGTTETTFSAKERATRAQSVAMLRRMLQYLQFIN
ncbi:fibronectin type III domain-containing protein [Cohnella silvisoli]|uniref:S-layer homology domain-containing protein n=1 Tax=Cohnella silvisoli TaxID=2873699 RepID=A0ABV1KQ35_9BACL|nr:S-layer homology domain-containing protein [Cohnella silvisoli]MCD9022163.1 S-layer homology domain-containing protein [Cohnella silvisoli]